MNYLRMRASRRLKPTARQAKFLCARGLACALGPGTTERRAR